MANVKGNTLKFDSYDWQKRSYIGYGVFDNGIAHQMPTVRLWIYVLTVSLAVALILKLIRAPN